MIPKDINLKQASAALDKMAGVARAFDDARKVMDVLLNAEQVVTEIDAQAKKAREGLAEAEHKLAVTRETAQTIEAQAKSVMADAVEEAAKSRRAAKAYVTRVQTVADEKASIALEQAQAEKAREAKFKKAIAVAQKELTDLMQKLAAAKKSAREMLS